MAYDPIHAPRALEIDIGRRGPTRWNHNGTDTAAVFAGNGFITNARDLGMKVGDLVTYRQDGVSPPVLTTHVVLVINANGSADLSDGTALSVTNAG